MRLAGLSMVILAWACSGDFTQTILRFHASPDLVVPAGTQLHLVGFADGARQHEGGRDLGNFDFVNDIKLPVDAVDDGLARRFTVFAELVAPSGERLSWARVRGGFVPQAQSQVRVDFASGCPAPSDQIDQAPDFDPYDVGSYCGSHDTCFADLGGARCASACVSLSPFDADTILRSDPVACPPSDDLVVEVLEAGWEQTFARSGNEVFTWGPVETGGLFFPRPSRPMQPNSLRTGYSAEDEVVAMAAANHVSCLVSANGELRCGGNNNQDAMGGIPEGATFVPCCAVAPSIPAVASIAVGQTWSCASLASSGEVVCSGSPPGTTGTSNYLPHENAPLGVTSLFGGFRTLLSANATAMTWIAAFARDPPHFDTDTAPAPDFRDIAVTGETVCAVSNEGVLSCWGNDHEFVPIPVQPIVLEGRWQRIAAAQYNTQERAQESPHLCAVAEDGTLWCWGDTQHGQLGSPQLGLLSFEQRVQVGTESNWSEVATGRDHTCGVRAGHVYCWGRRNHSQLGNGGGENSAPVHVPVPRW